MEDLVNKLIHNHSNPKTKIELPAQRFFLKTKTEDEENHKQILAKSLANLESSLTDFRVEKRFRAQWLPDRKEAKITKITGNLANFGYQNKSGKFLYPDDVLFLLETNKLELYNNGDECALSVHEAYHILSTEIDWNVYRVYKKFALQGYKLLRNLKQESVVQQNDDDNDVEEPVCKIARKSSSEFSEKLHHLIAEDYYNDSGSGNRKPDYYVFLPTNTSKTCFDFKLFIWNDFPFNTSNLVVRDFDSGIHAIVTEDAVQFYKIDMSEIKMVL